MSTGDGIRADNETAGEFVDEPVFESPQVAANHTSPDRVVFTETGNTDGWIATDLAVELKR